MRPVPVSVVVSTFDEGDRLARTVRSLLGADTVPSEVVLVDDGSTDGSCDRVWPEAVTVLRQDHAGIATARNAGARRASQPIVVFLDAHCSVEPTWLEPIIEVLRQEPEALVGPAVRDARERSFAGCGATLVDPVFTYRWLRAGTQEGHEVGLVPGGCLALTRSVFLESGGFASFRAFGLEDVELSLRWWRSGRPVLGLPASVVTHEFRARPPYRPDHQAWTENVLRTALLHLPPEPLRRCVTACSQFATFGRAMATVLGEPWIPIHQMLLATEARSTDEYLERWAPSAFGGNPRRPLPGRSVSAGP